MSKVFLLNQHLRMRMRPWDPLLQEAELELCFTGFTKNLSHEQRSSGQGSLLPSGLESCGPFYRRCASDPRACALH